MRQDPQQVAIDVCASKEMRGLCDHEYQATLAYLVAGMVAVDRSGLTQEARLGNFMELVREILQKSKEKKP